MRAFVLLEFIIGLIVVSLICVAGAKMAMQARKQEIYSYSSAQNAMHLQNVLLQISHILENATQIQIRDNKLYWLENEKEHLITIRQDDLIWNGGLLLDKVSDFSLSWLNENLLIKVCRERICVSKVVLMYGDER